MAATVLVYLNAFGNAFLWDDRFLVVDNPAIKHWGNIARIFTHALFPEGIQSRYYRPLQTLTYLVDYWRRSSSRAMPGPPSGGTPRELCPDP